MPQARTALDRVREHSVVRFSDVSLRGKDGRVLQMEVIGNIYSEKDRRVVQLNMRDLTERKRFERELQDTAKLESVGLLAGGIAHDFNNMLTGIMGNASLVYAETTPHDPSRPFLREIIGAAERASHLTRQLLAYAGKGKFVVQRINVSDLIREILILIRTSIPKTVEVRLELQDDAPNIEADPGQFQQVLMNLVLQFRQWGPTNSGLTGRKDAAAG